MFLTSVEDGKIVAKAAGAVDFDGATHSSIEST